MSFYKLVQFLKAYENTQRIKISITICLRTAQRWLGKLGYKYKDVCKDVFIDGHKRLNIIEDCKNFLKKIKELKLYMVEFEKDGVMKAKTYLFNCVVERPNQCSIMIITHNECILFANNGI